MRRTVRAATRTAPQNAASIAGLMITTEAMVAEAPKKEEAHVHGGGGGGMAAWAAAWIFDPGQSRHRYTKKPRFGRAF